MRRTTTCAHRTAAGPDRDSRWPQSAVRGRRRILLGPTRQPARPTTSPRMTPGAAVCWTAGDGGTVSCSASPRPGTSPEQIAAALLQPRTTGRPEVLRLPNAMVGYEPGYGAGGRRLPKGTSADAEHLRIIIIVAVVERPGTGCGGGRPVPPSSDDFGPDHHRRRTCGWPRISASTSTASPGAGDPPR